MPFTNYGLDHFVAQEMSKLTQCNAPEVANRFPESKSWVSNFVLNSFAGLQLSLEAKRFAFVYLRRAEAAFLEYDNGRAALSEFVLAARRQSSLYFRTLHHFEVTMAMLYQSYNFVRQLTGRDFFSQGDNTPYESLHHIYNASRYFNSDLPSEQLHAVWITNIGISTSDHSLSFEELKEFLEEVGRTANQISNGSLFSA